MTVKTERLQKRSLPWLGDDRNWRPSYNGWLMQGGLTLGTARPQDGLAVLLLGASCSHVDDLWAQERRSPLGHCMSVSHRGSC